MTMVFQSFFIVFFLSAYVTANKDTLQLLHVVFRHGDRTPDYISLYPNDPNINDTWFPEGYGQLTNLGKMMEFNIGKALRQRYGNFLGNIYTPDLLDPVSTNVNRTKMSLELTLAGLFPPAPQQTWNYQLPWQPIPYNYVDIPNSSDLTYSLYFCPPYAALYKQAEDTGYFADYLKTHAHLIEYINENSGLNITGYLDLSNLYFDLFAEVSTGRKIPKWTHKVYPGFLTNATILYYELQLCSPELVKLSAGGHLLKTILNHAKAKISNTLLPTTRKLFLYAAHEFNVAYILGAFNVYEPHIPPYASYVVIEFHKINGTYGFKILHQDYTHSQPQYMTIPGCETFCPIDETIELLKNHIPSDNDKCP